uniref:Uncharacterized protein n=1 Tax=viral metagenome TaxID=1070528 RepID=A0A6M3JFG1_9ZZZZ
MKIESKIEKVDNLNFLNVYIDSTLYYSVTSFVPHSLELANEGFNCLQPSQMIEFLNGLMQGFKIQSGVL